MKVAVVCQSSHSVGQHGVNNCGDLSSTALSSCMQSFLPNLKMEKLRITFLLIADLDSISKGARAFEDSCD